MQNKWLFLRKIDARTTNIFHSKIYLVFFCYKFNNKTWFFHSFVFHKKRETLIIKRGERNIIFRLFTHFTDFTPIHFNCKTHVVVYVLTCYIFFMCCTSCITIVVQYSRVCAKWETLTRIIIQIFTLFFIIIDYMEVTQCNCCYSQMIFITVTPPYICYNFWQRKWSQSLNGGWFLYNEEVNNFK